MEPSKTTVAAGRVFDVEANGAKVIQGLDVLASTGSYRTAMTRSLPVTVANEKLNLMFKPAEGDAIVSKITVVRQ
jgi:hypothetical protein